MQIFRVMHAVPYSNQAPVKDVMANLHSYFTCNLLIALAVLLSYKQFGGKPIECMLPMTGVTFSGAWEEYAEQYCWSEDTYYVPFNESVESFTVDQRREKRISYYQWIPFFLLFQAACFKFPTFVWKYFAGQSGMRVGEVLRLATSETNSEPSARTANIYALCVHLQGALKFQFRLKLKKLTPHKVFRFLNLKYSSYYVAFIYLLSKVCFLINVMVQTHLLNQYLVPKASEAFGFYAWRDLWYGNTTWEQNSLFPRVTLCDFGVREMGQTQNFTVQCVLLLNVFTEKVFIVLWGWYNILTAITVLNLSTWFFSLGNPRSSEHFIFNHLEMSGERCFANESNKGLCEVEIQVRRFIDKYLKTDGIFILRMIAQHADVVFTTDLISRLWDEHYKIEKQREALRLTNKRWKEHLARFKVIEKRIKDEIDSDSESEKSKSTKIPMNNMMQFSTNSSPSKRPLDQQTSQPTSPRLKRTTSIDEKRRPLKPGRSLMSSDSDDEETPKSPKPSESRRESLFSFKKGTKY